MLSIKQSKTQLLKRTAELQAIADNAEDFMVRVDRQFRYLFVNRALTVAMGIPFSDYIGKTNEDLGLSAELCDDWNRHFQEVFETSQPKVIEFECETVKGWRLFQSKIVPERWESDQVETLLVISRDITEQKQAEAALSLSERRFRLAAESIPETFVIYDPQRRFIFVNASGISQSGKSLDTLLGHTDEEVFPPEVTDAYLPVLKRAVETCTPQTTQCAITLPHTEPFFIGVKYVPLLDEEGEIYQILGFTYDITELKQIETAIRHRIEFESLLSRISTQFINLSSPELDKAINQALADIGEFVECDRAYIILLSEDSQVGIVTHEWYGDWLEPFPHEYRTLSTEPIPWWMEKLNRLETIEVPSLTGLPPNASFERWLLESQGIKSTLAVPIVFGTSPKGYIGFSTVQEEKSWSPDTVGLLRLVGEIFANTLKRQQSELELQHLNQTLETQVAQRTAELRTLIDAIPDHLFVINREGMRIDYCNEAFTQAVGVLSREQIENKTIVECFPPADAEYFIQQNQQVFDSGQRLRIEERLNFPQGTYYFDTIKVPLVNVQGEIYALLGTARDITPLKQAEAALRYSEENFRQLAETIDEVFFLLSDDKQQMFYISPAYEQIWGRSCQSLYDQPTSWLDSLHPDDRDRILAALTRQTQTQEDFQEEFRIIQPDGTIRWIRDRASLVYNESGQPYRIAGIAQDITDYKQAEQDLEQSQRFIQRIADASPNILYIYDLVQQRNIYINREIGNILGYTPAEIQAMGARVLSNLMHPDDFAKLPGNLQRIYAAADGEVLEFEYRMKHANGEWHWLYSRETVFTRTADGVVTQIIGAAEDISHRKRTEEQIKASLAEKEVLLREIHHRVKNNLNVIHSLLNMQSRTIKDKTLKNLLLDSQKRLQTMALIHEQLYQSENLSKIDFAEYIHRLVSNLFAAANLNHSLIQVEIQVEPIALNLETAIPSGLIINELLTNAFKYAFPDERSGSIRVEFYQDPDHRLHLSISDNGVGIPPDWNFQQTSSLGMKLVQILVQQLRATVEVVSHNGTHFHLTFSQLK